MPTGHVQPLLTSIGRAVRGAAALENVLLVDIARRRADREGIAQELGRELADLERRSAGRFVETLKGPRRRRRFGRGIDDLVLRRNDSSIT